jgi:hypothetical protein
MAQAKSGIVATTLNEGHAGPLRDEGIRGVYHSPGLFFGRSDWKRGIKAWWWYRQDLARLTRILCEGRAKILLIGIFEPSISLTTLKIAWYMLDHTPVQSVIVCSATPKAHGYTLEVFEVKKEQRDFKLYPFISYKHFGTVEAALRAVADDARTVLRRLDESSQVEAA